MSPRRPLPPEPPTARGVAGPALLVGAVMVFVYTAAGAMLGAVAVTLSPGPGTAGGVWDALVWVATVGLAGVAARPVLRRVSRPVAVGAGGGVLLAVAYAAVAAWIDAASAGTELLGARVTAMVAAGVLAGAWTAHSPGGDRADAEAQGSEGPADP